jgi:hypothetical protein
MVAQWQYIVIEEADGTFGVEGFVGEGRERRRRSVSGFRNEAEAMAWVYTQQAEDAVVSRQDGS